MNIYEREHQLLNKSLEEINTISNALTYILGRMRATLHTIQLKTVIEERKDKNEKTKCDKV